MSDDPEYLDTRRSREGQNAVTFRRHAASYCGQSSLAKAPMHDADLQTHMLAGPADNWADVAQKAKFLIERYAMTPDAQDVQVKILIRRVLRDMAQLARRGERAP